MVAAYERITTCFAYINENRHLFRDVCLFGAGDRTRTGTPLPARDFKSLVSTIPPHRHVVNLILSSNGLVVKQNRDLMEEFQKWTIFDFKSTFLYLPFLNYCV